MNKVKIKGIIHDLSGNSIENGTQLEFKAKDIKNLDFNLNSLKGKKIISVFPDINTRVCDLQTLQLSRLSNQNPSVNFVSVTMNDVNVIKEWCAAKSVDNLLIVSDKEYKDFATKTNLYIVDKNQLARGFILLDENNTIVDMTFKEEISEMPDFDKVDSWVKNM